MSRRRAVSIKQPHHPASRASQGCHKTYEPLAPVPNLEPFQLAAWIARAADEKLAQHIEILAFDDADGKTVPAGYFVMCTADSATHVRAISHGIANLLTQWWHVAPINRDVDKDGRWHILDYGPVLVHVMRASESAFYDLESLWSDRANVVPSLLWESLVPPPSRPEQDPYKIAS
ncbi:MAG: ribosome silencing factor [Vampirovibrionales bacterium]|nr:ribosome silencing factor [Vampirovibrionales bacterium]